MGRIAMRPHSHLKNVYWAHGDAPLPNVSRQNLQLHDLCALQVLAAYFSRVNLT